MKEESPRADVERQRSRFTKLIALNPNYFGNQPGLGFKPQLQLSRATTYEALRCVSYNATHDLLTATVELRRPNGYKGGLCGAGSREHVRFYVDRGAGWEDAGVAATTAHDIPEATDCSGDATLPLQYAVSVVYDRGRRPCYDPQLPRVRAILSWEVEPPPGQPDWTPVWGDVHECSIQLRPSRLMFADVLAALKVNLADLAVALPSISGDIALTASSKALAVEPPSAHELDLRYVRPKEVDVAPHRFAFPALRKVMASPATASAVSAEWESIGVSLPEVGAALEDLSGDTGYEELDCLALDNNRGLLTATFTVKRPYGYSGTLCRPGSREHVAFWADWDDTCEWTYLGTAPVTVHDFPDLPDGGLCYAAAFPVDLAAVRRPCHEAKPSRVRAVLSWHEPPSTTDPDDVPYWGNILDAHVQVAPGVRLDPANPVPMIAILGGVETSQIDPATGLTTPDAVLAEIAVRTDAAGRPCPFAGLVTVRGLSYPGLSYRILVRLAGGTWAPLTTPFRTVNALGHGTMRSPGPDGWTPFLDFPDNITSTLGAWPSVGDELWEVRMEIAGVPGADTRRVRLHNSFAGPDRLALHVNTGSCRQYLQGEPMGGTFTVVDPYLRSWGFSTLPGHLPQGVVTPPAGDTSVVNGSWTMTTGAMQPCGYVLQLAMSNRAIVDSTVLGRHAAIHEGFCIIAPG